MSGAHLSSAGSPEIEGADILLTVCGQVKPSEAVAIVCDAQTRQLGELLDIRARRITSRVTFLEAPVANMHGQEPPGNIAAAMSEVDLCVGITSKSMAHTKARLAAAGRGVRYLSLPDYSVELLADRSLRADYHGRAGFARAVSAAFTKGSSVRVKTAAGTDIVMSIAGRTGNCCPGFVSLPGELGSPPDIESNVSPIETSAAGKIVVDGSIPFPSLGLLSHPVTLIVKDGAIVEMSGEDETINKLRNLFDNVKSPKAYVLAECGVGLNDKASLTGVMLTDEGAAGTMHFGFGSNSTVGGTNEVPFHLDFVFKDPTLYVDETVVLRDGGFCLSLE